ncbi:MAG TPA: hypothetical protein PKA10_14335 [Selenomonadales bacterium]|nr:hypothetical protein [Selenomonadales bacterium]
MNISGVPTSPTAGFGPSTPPETLRGQREELFRQLAELHSSQGDSTEKGELAKRLVGMIKANDRQLAQAQMTDQYRAVADIQQRLLDETEKTLIQSAKKRKDSGVLVAASLRRILSANCKYRAAANGNGQMGSDTAEDIRKDLAAADKLGAEAAELARRKRQEQFKTELKKAGELKRAKAEKQKASEEKAADRDAELAKAQAKTEAAGKEARKKARRPLNVTV